MSRYVLSLTILFACALALAQDGRRTGGDDARETERGMVGPLQQITRQLKKFGPWENQVQVIEPAMDRLWEQNNWNDDADLFALNTTKEVARIPPWRVMDRLNRLTDLVGERYDFSDRQKMALQGSIMQETSGLLIKHGPALMAQVRKAVDKNAEYRDQPPSQAEIAEFMAEWTQATEALHQDAMQAFDRIHRGMAQGMDPRQRELLQRDLPTVDKLTRFVNSQREAWARGEWKPSDWGLSEDAFRRSFSPGQPPTSGRLDASRQALPVEMRWLSYEPKTWIAYLRHAIARYRLDEAQTLAVRSIHDELFDRATAYVDQRPDLERGQGAARGGDDAWAPVRNAFDELVRRVEAIPTQAQRDAATK